MIKNRNKFIKLHNDYDDENIIIISPKPDGTYVYVSGNDRMHEAKKSYQEIQNMILDDAPTADMGWISVDDILPEISDDYIVCVEFNANGKCYRKTYCAMFDPLNICDDTEGVTRFGDWNFYIDICEGEEIHVTHWMPLPKPVRRKDND